MTKPPFVPTGHPARADSSWRSWIVRVTAGAGVLVVGWVCVTSWGAIVHGHPLFGVLLGATLLGSAFVGWRTFRPRRRRTGWRRVAHVALLLASLGWIALMAWLRPFSAVEPALAALRSDTKITVAESPTQIVLTPTGSASHTGVFFQPGARVDPRAYAAILRPLAEAGHVVVIAKQPLGIAFLSVTALDATGPDHQHLTRWVVGGHSLGGTVAAMQANVADTDPTSPIVGLLLFASYPANDISTSLRASVLSISGSRDGLATPDKIAASKATLPASTTFTSIDGAVHSFFGDYGAQPGDGTPTISHDEARTEVSRATVDFVNNLSR
jgi:hypothetical protein